MKKYWTGLVIFVVLLAALFIDKIKPAARVRDAIPANEATVQPATVEEPDSAFSAGSESTANVLMEAAALLTDKDIADMERLDGLGWSDEDQAGLEAFLAYKARVYELLMLASAMPPADFGMITRKSPGVVEMLPHFRRLLRLEARTLAVNGRPDSAGKVLDASAELANAVQVYGPHSRVVGKSVVAKVLQPFRAFRAWLRKILFPAPHRRLPEPVGVTPGATAIKQLMQDEFRAAHTTAPSAGASIRSAANSEARAARLTQQWRQAVKKQEMQEQARQQQEMKAQATQQRQYQRQWQDRRLR